MLDEKHKGNTINRVGRGDCQIDIGILAELKLDVKQVQPKSYVMAGIWFLSNIWFKTGDVCQLK